MISAKRMVEIFRRRGGEDFANLAEKLTEYQITYLKERAEGEPIIAVMSSENEWFVLTRSHFVFTCATGTRAIPIHEIQWASTPKTEFQNVEGLRKIERLKSDGGDLAVELQDGTSLRVKVRPGGPYFGLMNVLMRIARINLRRSTRETSGQPGRPATDDPRPTTSL
jgi:hypothetical protein